MGVFNWVLNLVPALSLAVSWLKKLFNVKLIAFIVFKAVLFFLFYKFLPHLFGKFYQWIYDLGVAQNLGIDLPAIIESSVIEVGGITAWLFYQFKIDTCLKIMIAGALVRLGIRPLPFLGR
jgi:hypothetical protein